MFRKYTFLLFLLFGLVVITSFAEPPVGPEKWESSIAEFEARDQESPPKDGMILFVGSSSIRLWDLGASWPETNVLNNGFGGSTLADSIHYFDRIIAPYRPAAIVIYAGDNDIARELTAEETSRDFQTLAGMIEKTLPGTPVIYIAIKPSIKRWELWPEMKAANEAIAAICKENPNLYFADIAAPMLEGRDGPPAEDWFKADGLHLNEEGYSKWKKVVTAELKAAGVIE